MATCSPSLLDNNKYYKMSTQRELPSSLQEKVDDWLKYDTNEQTCQEILKLVEDFNVDELHKRLDSRITFGTAGLRGKMEAGFTRMNTLTVRQASQGLAMYIKSQFPDNLTIVIGHDHRYNSKSFANTTVETFLQLGFKVYHLNIETEESFVHTPLVPFSINSLGASVGVMITASHNPKMDNGYKVYYANGCQIIPPHDRLIDDLIDQNLIPLSLPKTGTVIDCKRQMSDKYVETVSKSLLVSPALEKPSHPWFIYTPMHGVGLEIFERVGKEILSYRRGQDYICVAEQASPDPAFPTVTFPNPEEKGALDLAIKYGKENVNIDLIVANDPDADRFSVAIRNGDEWKQLTGNEIGFLLALNELEKYRASSTKKSLAMINSTVSSRMLKRMADIEGFHYEDTLTGFKWLGNRALQLEHEGYFVPFAYEEAIGYMFPSVVHDKDGISAAVAFLQAYLKWSAKGLTPLDVLNNGYAKYGYFKEFNGYYIVPDLSATKRVFDSIRSIESPYPTQLGTSFQITQFRDLTVGYQSDTENHVPDLPVDPTSQMITCELELANQPTSQVRVTIRGSGTEPKLKVYIEAHTNSERTSIALAKLAWDTMQDEWFKPKLTGLVSPFH